MRIPNSLLASSLVVLAALAPLSCARANPELEGKAASAGDLAGPRWKVIDKTGREIFSVPTNVRLGDYSENLAMFACWDGEQSEFGYLAPDGAIAIPAGFGSGTNFHKGRAFVHLRPRTASGSLSVGIINRRGKILKRVDSHYLSLYGATNDGFFQIERLPGGRGSHGLVDNRGRILIPCKYDWVDSPREQLVVVRDGNEYGYLDLSGQEVVAPSYTLGAGFSEGLARVAIERQRNDGVVHISCLPIDPRYGFIDKRGKLVLPTSYKSAGSFSEGLSAVEDSGGCKYIDKTGADAFGTTFEAARSFSSGLAAVRKNGLWGFIDRSGRLVIPYRYILAGPFEGDSAVFAIHGSGRKSSLCDIQHNKLEFDERIREPSFLKALTLDDCFRPRLKFGVVDRTGSEIVEPIYDNILPLSDGMRLVEKEDRYGFIDRSGKEVIPPAFRFATDFNCGRAQVTEEPIPYRDKLSFGQASDPIIPVTPRQDCVPPTVDPDTTESNIQTCSRVIALEPESATAYANRGWFAFALGRYQDALADFKKAAELRPKDLPLKWAVGNCYLKLRQWKKADSVLGYLPAESLKLSHLEPDNWPLDHSRTLSSNYVGQDYSLKIARARLGRFERIALLEVHVTESVFEWFQDYEDLEDVVNSGIMSVCPSFPPFLFTHPYSRDTLERRIADLESMLSDARAKKADESVFEAIYRVLGRLLDDLVNSKTRRYEVSGLEDLMRRRVDIKKHSNRGPNPYNFARLDLADFLEGMDDPAAEDIYKSIRSLEYSHLYNDRYAMYLVRKERFKEAVSLLKTTSPSERYSRRFLNILSRMCERDKLEWALEKSKALYDKAREFEPGKLPLTPLSSQGDCKDYLELARSSYDLGQVNAAHYYLEKARKCSDRYEMNVELDRFARSYLPDQRVPLEAVSLYCQVIGPDEDKEFQFSELTKSLMRCIDLAPNFPHPQQELVSLYCSVGSYDQAESLLKSAVKRFRNFVPLWMAAGKLYLDTGWKDKALEAYKTALKLDPTVELAQREVKRLGK